MFVHTIRQTAAAAITLPQGGMYLTRAKVGQASGSTPGDVAWLYDGSANAHFPTASTAGGTQDGLAEYDLNWSIKGTNIPVGVFTFTGTISWVEWTFWDVANGKGAPLTDYRGSLFRRVDAGATTATINVTYDVAPAKPKAMVAFCTPATRGRFQWPATGNFQGQVECVSPPSFRLDKTQAAGPLVPEAAPDVPTANSLTLTGISDAASTIMAVVYY